MFPVALSEVAVRIAIMLGLLLAVGFNGGPLACAAAVVCAQAVGLGILLATRTRGSRARLAPRFRVWGSLLREAWPIGLALGVYSVYVKVDVVILARLSSKQALAEYSLAYRVVDLVTGLLVAAILSLTAPLHDAFASGQHVFRGRLLAIRRRALAVSIALVLLAWPAAPVVVRLLGGHQYAHAARPLAVLLVATGFSAFQALYNTSLVALGRGRELLPLTLLLLVLNVGANVLTVRRYGADGAALVTLATEVVSVLICSAWIRRDVSLPALSLRLRLGIVLAGAWCVAAWPLLGS
jgi:O-antigen/teichoic acid export membrane protein